MDALTKSFWKRFNERILRKLHESWQRKRMAAIAMMESRMDEGY